MKDSSRLHAFLAHLGISTIILLIMLGVIFWLWFPNGLIYAGGLSGLKILFGVDMVLGPLLTFIVFKPGKKGLILDLWLIGFLQITCLCLGLWQIYQQRPVLQVISDKGIHLISASDASKYNINIDIIKGRTPKAVMINLPKEKSKWSAIVLASEFVDEKPFSTREDLYISLNNVSQNNFRDRLNKINSSESDVRDSTECIWLPVISTHFSGSACVNKSEGIIRLNKDTAH